MKFNRDVKRLIKKESELNQAMGQIIQKVQNVCDFELHLENVPGDGWCFGAEVSGFPIIYAYARCFGSHRRKRKIHRGRLESFRLIIMEHQIKFQDENHHLEGKKDWTDLEWIDEFYEFLQGNCPGDIHLVRGHQPKMTAKKAFTIIWYLQEHMRILPYNIEKCSNCGELFDSNGEGIYWESKGKHFCGGCEYVIV